MCRQAGKEVLRNTWKENKVENGCEEEEEEKQIMENKKRDIMFYF